VSGRAAQTGGTGVDGAHLFVFGAAHSGTTIAYRMLAYHPDLVWPSQFSLRGGEVPGRRRVPAAGLLDRQLRRRPYRWTKGRESALRRYVVPRPVEARTLWQYVLGAGDEAGTERLRRSLGALSERFGGGRVVAKLPELDRHLDLLQRAFPRASFLHLVRDGRAVALSLRPKFERRLDGEAALREAASHWVDVVGRATGTPGVDPIQLRYEDLCADVHGSLRTVLERCGLDPGRFPFERCPERLSISNSRWIDAASEADLTLIAAVEAEALRRLGYPAATVRSGGGA
jgi:hypothetical protein